MQWDLGLQGLGVLLALSVGFGVVAQLVFWGQATRWLWVIATGVFFVVGVLISEVWFGWATETDLQPNIDGLSFDEVLVGFGVGMLILIAVRYVTGRSGHRPMTS